MDSALDLYPAVVNLLKAQPDIAALVGARVYGAPPAKGFPLVYPYMVVTGTGVPFASDSFSGIEHTLRIQSFARENKPATVLVLRKKAFAAIDRQEASIAVPGLVLMQFDGMADAFPEPDGRTYQSLIEFKALVN
jgi:hypothetical protein